MKKITYSLVLLISIAATTLQASPDLASKYGSMLADNYQLKNPARTTISLNGVWKIALCETITPKPPSGDAFGFVLVPSSWVHTTEFPITDSPNFEPGSWSGTDQWLGKKTAEYPSAWYVRDFDSPERTKTQRVYLKLDRVTISGTVLLNGQLVGTLTEREDTRWDVTELLAPAGKPNRLEVRVDALLSKMVKAFLGGDETVIKEAKAHLRGITGDTWLIVEPNGPVLQDLFITTSTRKSTITFNAKINPSVQPVGPTDFIVDVYEKSSQKKVKEFTQTIAAPSATDGSITMTHAWTDAVLWDTDQPQLYTAVARLQSGDTLLDQTFPEVFGFREVWIEGRDIIMNGKPLHLFSYHSHAHDTFVNASRKVAEAEIDAMTRVGFNSIQLGSEGTFSDGRSAQYYHDVLKLTDQKGVPVVMPIFPIYAYGWDAPEQRERWTQHMQALVKRYRNHPSLIIYGMNFNYLGYGWDMNPHTWASGYQPPDTVNNLGKKRSEADASVALLKKEDDSRLVYNHASGNYGDFITSNFYPCWPPLQELGDALSGWSQAKSKPMIFVELSLPVYTLDLMRARQGNYMDVRYSEMLEAEYLSETLGPEAYTLQSDEYLDMISEGATTEEKAGTDKYEVNQSYIWSYALRLHEPLTSGMHALRPDFFKTWRTYGLTGFSPNNRRYTEYYGKQYEPWHGPAVNFTYDDYTEPGPKPLSYHIPQNMDPTTVAEMTKRNLQPAMVYFGGDEESGFSSKDHAWFSGNLVKKQLVLVNDTRHDLEVMVPWRLERPADGQMISEGQVAVKAAAGTSGFASLTFNAPKVEEKTTYRLVAEWPKTQTQPAQTFPFAIEVFPLKPMSQQVRSATIGLFDPVGQTSKALEAMGLKATAIDATRPIPDCDVYIVGRDVLSATTRIPQALLSKVIDQGKSLVCFEQQSLQDFGLRMHARGQRTAFPLVKNHPVLRGLQAEDLRHWRGAYSLTPAYPPDRKETPGLYPEEFWKWGNRGVVASYMIEKPAAGPLLSLAECGFDLKYTPLAELREGRGTVLLCQLEVTERIGTDPAATSIFKNLLEYASKLNPRTEQAVALSGGLAEDPLLLSAVGSQQDMPGKIILHSGPVSDQQRQMFTSTVQKGGTVFLVGQETLSDVSWLPGKLKTAPKTYFRAQPTSTSALARGISRSDTFIKDRRRDALPQSNANAIPMTDPGIIVEVPAAQGRFILVAIDPVPYRSTEVTPERSKRIYTKLMRMLCTMTSNLGGHLTPLSQSYLDGFSTARVDLPDEWKFSIDLKNNGAREKWQLPDYDDADWQTLDVPGLWENQGVTNANPRFAESKRPYDGFAWYRCNVTLPEEMSRAGDLFLSLGAIDDMDTTYVNGTRVGVTGRETENPYAVERRYHIPPSVLEGRTTHTIAVRVYDPLGGGGITGPDLYIDRGEADPYPYQGSEPPFNPYKLKRW